MEGYEDAKYIQSRVKSANSFAAKVGFLAIGLVVGLLIGIGAAFFFKIYNPPDEPAQPAGLELPAPSVVFERVQSQSEMVTASQRYNITEKSGTAVTVPFVNLPLPFTENSYWYRCVGNIKVAVNLQNAGFSQDGNVVKIELDKPYISSNTPDMEQSGVLEENNNILNQIRIEDVDEFRAGCVEMSESKAVEDGILDDAMANAETNLKNIFGGAFGDEYTVEVVWREA